MTRDAFDQNAEEICTAVRLLLADSKRRRKFQLATVYESHTNELLAEVLATSFGPVVVYSTGIGASTDNNPIGLSRQYRANRPIAPLIGGDQTFDVMSRSNTSHDLSAADLIRFIANDVDPAATNLTFKRVASSA